MAKKYLKKIFIKNYNCKAFLVVKKKHKYRKVTPFFEDKLLFWSHKKDFSYSIQIINNDYYLFFDDQIIKLKLNKINKLEVLNDDLNNKKINIKKLYYDYHQNIITCQN